MQKQHGVLFLNGDRRFLQSTIYISLLLALQKSRTISPILRQKILQKRIHFLQYFFIHCESNGISSRLGMYIIAAGVYHQPQVVSFRNDDMCTREMARAFLFDFLFKHLVEHNKTEEMNDMIHNGFSEEFLRLFEWYTGKHYKNKKSSVANAKEVA